MPLHKHEALCLFHRYLPCDYFISQLKTFTKRVSVR
jgi:hypothetical protein